MKVGETCQFTLALRVCADEFHTAFGESCSDLLTNAEVLMAGYLECLPMKRNRNLTVLSRTVYNSLRSNQATPMRQLHLGGLPVLSTEKLLSLKKGKQQSKTERKKTKLYLRI